MICPICDVSETRVTNTVKWGTIVYRCRKCKDPECQAVIFTKEWERSDKEYNAILAKKNQARKKIREIRRRARGHEAQ
jgi:transcriptional regulator NrdR family protein